MKDYGPRVCIICRKEYIPRRSDQRTCGCPECKRRRQRLNQLDYRMKNYAKVLEGNKRLMKEKRDAERYKPKPDTIIAIGYAERQIADSLKKAGKVNTKL